MTGLRDQIVQALAEVGAELLDAGIRSSPNPAEVPVPGAWLNLRTFDVTDLAGGGTAELEIRLVVPGGGTRLQSLGELLQMLDAALAAGPLVPTEPVDLDAPLSLPDQPNLPGALLVVALDI